jgi:CheY-like chemotaxis protein
MTEPNILVVEDDVETRQLYQEILEDAGYQVTLAGSRQVALDALASGKDWWVVLIDRMLQGGLGGDEGTGLLTAVRDQAPAAVAIVVTGYINPDAIKRAFELGAWDYIEKSRNFHHVLLAKVRNAVEAQRDRRLAGRDPNLVVREAWAAVQDDTVSSQVKGSRLEALVVALFRSVPGFAHARTNMRNDSQEFDVVVRNESTEPFWARQGDYFIAECKRWNERVDPDVLYTLQGKAHQRYGRCKLAFLVAWSGFTRGLNFRLLPGAEKDLLVVPLDRADLEAWVNATDRGAELKRLHERAALEEKP